MKSNRITWGLTSVIVLVTLVISFGTMTSHSQKDTSKIQNNEVPGDLSKYAVAEFDAPTSKNQAEREARAIKNKRYDKLLLVSKKPNPETIRREVSDAEPIPSAIPYNESSLVVIGEVINSKAFISNDKTGVYSEYDVRVDSIVKANKRRNPSTGANITIDRTGGYVQYPSGQKVLHLNDWQDMPELNERYVFFLSDDNDENPNYKIITGYRLQDGKVSALDRSSRFYEFNGLNENDFIKRILSTERMKE